MRHRLCHISARRMPMQFGRISAAGIVLLGLTIAPAYAGQRGNSGNHGTSTHANSIATAPTPHGPSATDHGHGAATASAKPPKTHDTAGTKKTPVNTTHTQTKHPTVSAPVTSGPINFSTTPVAQKLAKNT